ncbi:MAG: hypothetical protein H6977_12800 [Gammaproteobacteria bacterium]|nr:hypothetical protein [Gammaproteobacteria bacterium]MCP5200886.1 hypothetical protein [Gammaproteobacteria bacterium]
MAIVEVLVPVAATRTTAHPLAARPARLAGARIGWLDNLKANAGALLDGIAAQLAADAVAPALRMTKNATAAAPEAVMAHLRTCDAVVLAIAD